MQNHHAVILEPEKIKSATVSTVSPSICHEVKGLDAMILVFWMLSFKLIVSFQFSCSVVSDSLRPHELQHTRPPCLSPTPRVHSDSRPLSWWCHPAISSSAVFYSCPQSLPASESFPMSQLFTWGGQSFSFSIIPSKEILGLISFRIDWLDLLAVQGTLKSLLQHHSSKASILWHSAFFTVQLSPPHMTTGKTIALTRRTSAFQYAI